MILNKIIKLFYFCPNSIQPENIGHFKVKIRIKNLIF
jgi:hypothetical protein